MGYSGQKRLSLVENTLWNSIGCSVYLGCQWLITILVVTLSTGFENSGTLAMAMAVGNIYSPLAQYRVRPFQVSDVGGQYATGNYVAFRFVTIAGSLVACGVYAIAISGLTPVLLTIGLYLLFKTDEAFSDVLYGVDQYHARMDYIGVSQMIRGIVSLIAFSSVLMIFQDLNLAIVSMFATCLCVTLFYDIPKAGTFGSLLPTIKIFQVKQLLALCLPGALSVAMVTAVVSIPRQFFGVLYGEDALGVYAAMAAPMVLVQISASYLYSPLLGSFAEKVSERDFKGFAAQLRRVCVMLAALIVAMTIIMAFAGEPVLVLLYGDVMREYSYLIVPLVISTALVALMWFSIDTLVVLRKMKFALVGNAVAFVSCIASTYFLLTMWYMNGINYTVIISLGIGVLVSFCSIVLVVRRMVKGERSWD